MSCKKSIGRAGPGGNKNTASNSKAVAGKASVGNAGSRDLTYVPYTSPLLLVLSLVEVLVMQKVVETE